MGFGLHEIGRNRTIMAAAKDMNDLVLAETIVECGVVLDRPEPFEWAIEAHFLTEASFCGRCHRLAWPRMSAARIGPQAARMILRRGALLQKLATGRIPNDNGEGAVQQPSAMRIDLLRRSQLTVVGVDKNELLGRRLQCGTLQGSNTWDSMSAFTSQASTGPSRTRCGSDERKTGPCSSGRSARP